MKASAPDQRRLLDVQALDTRARQLIHKARSLPEHADIASLEERRTLTRDRLVHAQTAVSDVERDVTKAEADVQQVRDRTERDRQRLEAGGSAKDLVGLQHELETLARRQATLEEVELDAMERLEQAQADLARITQESAEQEETLQGLVARRDEQVNALKAEHGGVAEERRTALEGVDEKLLALYARVAEKSGGLGAAELVDNRCGGCRLELNPVDLTRIKAAAPDDVVQCEECSCILVR